MGIGAVVTMDAGAETGEETRGTGEAEATGAPRAAGAGGRSAASAVQWDGAPASSASNPRT